MTLRSIAALLLMTLAATAQAQWAQWGRDPQHSGRAQTVGQTPATILADFVYDPLVPQETAAEGGELLVHYQAPIVDGDDVFMEVKSGTFSPATWSTQVWGISALRWTNGRLAQRWTSNSDWKPPEREPGVGPEFEPVFHPLLSGSFLYLPAAGGTVLKVDRESGTVAQRINPFGSTIDRTRYVASPLTAAGGNVYYTVLQLDSTHPWTTDVIGSWLVRIDSSGGTSFVSYTDLTAGAQRASDACVATFSDSELPWPPSPDAVPPSIQCGTQRAALNAAPAVAPDGTIYTVSRAHFNSRYSYLVAVNPNLTPKWISTMRNRFNDGCNVLLPPNGTVGGCREGATTGVDPSDNLPGSGRANDSSSASPVVAPDGTIFYGSLTRYNYDQGHLLHFSPAGDYLGAYQFGWDITPGIFVHGDSYSIITKDNRYELPSYCDNSNVCGSDRPASNPEFYAITSLSPSLNVEWQFRSTNTQSCRRDASGNVTCRVDHPRGFEWCVNAPAIDAGGAVFVNSEDGFLYAIDAGGHLQSSIFLQLALGAAYTPLSIDQHGRVYTQNAGHLFVTGALNPPRRRAVRR